MVKKYISIVFGSGELLCTEDTTWLNSLSSKKVLICGKTNSSGNAEPRSLLETYARWMVPSWLVVQLIGPWRPVSPPWKLLSISSGASVTSGVLAWCGRTLAGGRRNMSKCSGLSEDDQSWVATCLQTRSCTSLVLVTMWVSDNLIWRRACI